MAKVNFRGNPIRTSGELPAVGQKAPDFDLVRGDLSSASLRTFAGKRKVVNVFPSIDTPVCAASVRAFNQKAAGKPDVVVLNVSADLPFAFKRFCATEGISGAESLSTFRSTFAKDYGVRIEEGPLTGLCARAVLVLDARDEVVYTELVPDIGQEPAYDRALAAL